MPAAPTAYPYLSWKYRKIVLRFPIPKPVQAILGKPMFRCVMAQSDMPSAHAASLPILAEWRRRIAAAKSAGQDHVAAEIMKFRREFEAFEGKPLSAAEIDMHERMYAFLAHQGGVEVAKQRLIRAEAQGNMERSLAALPAPAQAPQTLALVNGTAQPTTPFLTHLEGKEGWKARTHLRGKSFDQAVTAVEEFAKAVPCDLETLTGGVVQAWIDGQLRPTDDSRSALPETVRKKLTGLRSYWGWMQNNDRADKERHPFTGRSIRDHRTARERLESKPKAFEVADVPRLWQQAEADADRDLFAVTKIGAHTGMRREEICALKVNQVLTHAETGIRYLEEVGDKTEAAIRNVPIPSAIALLIDELVANATADGYLIHDGYIDKNGHRGGEVGGRFSDMKTAMGFSPQYQFRSLRKTAIKLMKEQKLVTPPFLLSIIKNIVGHHDSDITSGRYAGTSGLTDKLEVIETIRY